MRARRLEIIFGVLGGVLGLAALGFSLFAPLGMTCIDMATPEAGSRCYRISAVQAQGVASLSFAITLFGALSLAIALFALLDGLSRNVLALVLLWLCTFLLWFATVLAVLSIGIFFVPADALALAASISGLVASRSRTPVHV